MTVDKVEVMDSVGDSAGHKMLIRRQLEFGRFVLVACSLHGGCPLLGCMHLLRR